MERRRMMMEKNVEYKNLTFTILTDGNFSWNIKGNQHSKTLSYRKNGGAWIELPPNTTVDVVTGDEVEFVGDTSMCAKNFSYFCYFNSTADLNLSGSLNSLIGGSDAAMTDYAFVNLFGYVGSIVTSSNACGTRIISAQNLIMPKIATVNCYRYMFYGCKLMTTPPQKLPAKTLYKQCYYYMFCYCTSLTTAPELPATTLIQDCYNYMFGNCTSLTTAPELPATTLARWCYQNMFYKCSNLSYIKAMFTDTPGSNYTSGWVNGVSASGTFVKNSAATWNVTGNSGIPSGWTVITASS